MGVKVRRYKGSWYVFIDHLGQRKAKKVGSREAAESVRRKIEVRLAPGDLSAFEQTKHVPTFAAYAERWLKTDAPTRCKPSTVDFYADYQKRYVLPEFGQTELVAISRDAIKDFIARLSGRGLARNTIRLAVASFRVVLSAAVEDGLLPSNPAAKLGQFVKTNKPEHKAMSMEPEEVELFLSSAREHCPDHHPLFLIALRAGLHQGEILGLKWGDFQFGQDEDDKNRYIFVQRRWYRGTFSTPKGGKARRVICPANCGECFSNSAVIVCKEPRAGAVLRSPTISCFRVKMVTRSGFASSWRATLFPCCSTPGSADFAFTTCGTHSAVSLLKPAHPSRMSATRWDTARFRSPLTSTYT